MMIATGNSNQLKICEYRSDVAEIYRLAHLIHTKMYILSLWIF